jgi:diguanylate cyclase (GGDEF)-like protein
VLNTILTQLYRNLPNNPEQRFRGQLMLGILATLIGTNLVALLYFSIWAPLKMDTSATHMAVAVISVATAINFLSLVFLLRGQLMLAAAIITGIETLAMWVVIGCTSGVPDSPAMPLMLAPVVFGFCLMGPRAGMTVAFTTLIVLLGLWYVPSHFGWVLPAMQSRRNPSFDSTLIAGVNSFIVIAVLMIYEYITARLREQLGKQASRDDLTGVGNRRDFMARLAQACARCNRSNGQLAVFYIDLNGFKPINDRLGHQGGDQVLKVVAERLRSGLRLQDIVARLGGDEFAVITEPKPGENYLDAMTNKLRQTICEPIVIGGQRVEVGASIGVALYPNDGVQPEELLRHADTAMYREKNQARN